MGEIAALTAPPFEGDIDDVIDLAVAEMGKRLRDHADEVPAHALSKFVAEANKAAERRKAAKESEEQEAPSILETIDSLPPRKAAELLRQEIKRRDAALEDLHIALRELEGRDPEWQRST